MTAVPFSINVRSALNVLPATKFAGAPALRAVRILRRKTIGIRISSMRRGTAIAVSCQS